MVSNLYNVGFLAYIKVSCCLVGSSDSSDGGAFVYNASERVVCITDKGVNECCCRYETS